MLIAYLVRLSVTTAFSHLRRTVCYPFLMSCGPHNKEQKKALTKKKERKNPTVTDFDKCTDFSFFFNLM